VRRPGGQTRGFTLIELLIVVAVIAVVAMAAAPAVNSFTGTNARVAAGQLAGASRYLFDTAALRHETCRLALDMDKRAWWAECTAAAQEGRRRQPVVAKDGTAEDDEEALARKFADERDPEKYRFFTRARFSEFKDREVKRRPLPGSAAFDGLWTPRQREVQSKGTGYVYYYPQGQSDSAQVSVADGDNVYTVVLEPLTGRARVVAGRPEVPR